jgi:hypothetical protein
MPGRRSATPWATLLAVALCLAAARAHAGEDHDHEKNAACPIVAPESVLGSLCAKHEASASPACELFRLCRSSDVQPPLSSSVCNATRLYGSLCLDVDGICAEWVPLGHGFFRGHDA